MERIFKAVLKGVEDVEALVEQDSSLVHARVSRDELVTRIPHWLYVGDTPLHLAAAAQDATAARTLLRHGADPNARNRRGATPLHYACDARPRSVGTSSAASSGLLIEALVRGGAELDAEDKAGVTALHRAVRGRNVAAVQELLALGARPNLAPRRRGTSALHLAARATGAGGTRGTRDEQLKIIGLLRQHGADLKQRDERGRTPVEWATNGEVATALQA